MNRAAIMIITLGLAGCPGTYFGEDIFPEGLPPDDGVCTNLSEEDQCDPEDMGPPGDGHMPEPEADEGIVPEPEQDMGTLDCDEGFVEVGNLCIDHRPANIWAIFHESWIHPNNGAAAFRMEIDSQIVLAEIVGSEPGFELDENGWFVFGNENGAHLVLRHEAIMDIFSGEWVVEMQVRIQNPSPNGYAFWVDDDEPGGRMSPEGEHLQGVALHGMEDDSPSVVDGRSFVSGQLTTYTFQMANGLLCIDGACVNAPRGTSPNRGELRFGADNHLDESGRPDRIWRGQILSFRAQRLDQN